MSSSASPTLGASTWRRAGAYARLLKLNVPELSLYPLVAMGLTAGHAGEGRYWTVHALFLAYSFCCATLSITLDDIMGYVDGVDQLGQLGAKRNIAKPLLTGELELREAIGAALVIVGVAVALLASLAASSAQPGWAALLLAALLIGVAQYSFGLKLSYRGLGEPVIAYGAAMTIALPCWILLGTLDARAAWTAAIAGLPYAAQIVVSNMVDYESDRASHRDTLTVMIGLGRAPWVAAGILLVFWSLVVEGLVGGVLPVTSVIWVAMVPNHVRFVRLAMAGDPAGARLLSFQTIRLQLVLFPLALAVAIFLALG